MWKRKLGDDLTQSQINVIITQKWKTIKMLIATVAVFTLCWLPFFIFNFIAFKSDSSKTRPCNQNISFLLVIWIAFSRYISCDRVIHPHLSVCSILVAATTRWYIGFTTKRIVMELSCLWSYLSVVEAILRTEFNKPKLLLWMLILLNLWLFGVVIANVNVKFHKILPVRIANRCV